MKVTGIEPQSGKESDLELPESEKSFLEAVKNLDMSDSAVSG